MMAATLLGFSGLPSLAQSDDLLPLLPAWDHLVILKAGAGYKDNTTLSHVAPEASPFLATGLEAMIFNLDPEGLPFNAFISGDHNQYFASPSVDNEQLVFGQAQLELPVRDLKGSLAAEYFYQNQVLDVSATETNQEAILVRGHTFAIRPGFKWTVFGDAWIALEIPGSRQLFNSELDDYWEGGPKCVLGYNYGHKSYVSLDYEAAWRAYDTESERDAEGYPIAGTHRRILQHDLRLSWRHYWDANRRWRTTLRPGFKASRDQAAGYFNYNRCSGSVELRYRNRQWDLNARVRASYYYYPVQTVSASDPSPRERTELVLTLRGERQLTRSLKLVAEYEHENTWASQILEAYTVNVFSGGVQWEF